MKRNWLVITSNSGNYVVEAECLFMAARIIEMEHGTVIAVKEAPKNAYRLKNTRQIPIIKS